jgi:signal transduction histidine kinase
VADRSRTSGRDQNPEDDGSGIGDTADATYDELRAINERLVIASVRMMERVEIAEEQQRRALAAAQEEERRRLSRELHDQTGQHLTGLALGLQSLQETIRDHCPPETGTEEKLRHLHHIAEALARDIHRIAVELRPTALDDLGLIPVLENYVETRSADNGVPAAFGRFGLDEERLSEMGKMAVYRVVQEALTNILQYAVSARVDLEGQENTIQVSVTLQTFRDHLQETIEDKGPGFAAIESPGYCGHAGASRSMPGHAPYRVKSR